MPRTTIPCSPEFREPPVGLDGVDHDSERIGNMPPGKGLVLREDLRARGRGAGTQTKRLLDNQIRRSLTTICRDRPAQ